MRSWEGVRGGEDAGEMSQHGCTIIANRYNNIRCIVHCNKPIHSDNCASFLITCMQLNHIQST